MKKFLALFIVALTLASSMVLAEDPPPPIVVVVHPQVARKDISLDDLKNVYLGKITFWPDNTSIKVFDRPVDRPAGQTFYRDVLKMVPARFRHHWQSLQLAGRGIAPEGLASADDVIGRVAATPGAVAYLHASEVPKTGLKGVVALPIVAGK